MILNLSFELLELKDCIVLHEWLQLEHVKLFWDDGDRTPELVINHYMVSDNTQRFLFYLDSSAAGYMQSYTINDNDIGIDFFIGNIRFLGKGYATRILEEFIRRYCSNKNVVVDPVINNHRAIHIYQKAGFSTTNQFTENGITYQLMRMEWDKLDNK